MIKAKDAAHYLCEKSGWTLSNLEAQKLLYIASVYYIGRHNDQLLNENFEAWDYGPVIDSLYHELKMFGSRPVKDVFFSGHNIEESSNEGKILQGVVMDYIKRRAEINLVSVTHHDEGAWAKSYTESRGSTIPYPAVLQEYEKRVKKAAR